MTARRTRRAMLAVLLTVPLLLAAVDGRAGERRLDAAEDQYCSYWEPTGWDCYEVYSDGPDSIIWVATGSGTRYPARVVEGDQL